MQLFESRRDESLQKREVDIVMKFPLCGSRVSFVLLVLLLGGTA